MTDYKIIKIREPIEDYYVVWDGIYELQKSDFNGPIRNKKTAETASKKIFEADAQITSIDDKIHFKISRIRVIAIVSKEHSWMNDELVKYQNLNEILQHEQLHFVVEEAYARKLQRFLNEEIKKEFTINEIEGLAPEQAVEAVIQKYLDKRRKWCQKITDNYQDEYDDAVHDDRNNRIPEIQKEYDEKIKKLLDES